LFSAQPLVLVGVAVHCVEVDERRERLRSFGVFWRELLAVLCVKWAWFRLSRSSKIRNYKSIATAHTPHQGATKATIAVRCVVVLVYRYGGAELEEAHIRLERFAEYVVLQHFDGSTFTKEARRNERWKNSERKGEGSGAHHD